MTEHTPVQIDATQEVRVTIRTSATGTVQAWGRITGTSTVQDTRTLTSLSLTNATVYDGRLREAANAISDLHDQSTSPDVREAYDKVLTLLEKIQPVERITPVQ